MSWGAFWMFYECEDCKDKFRFEIGDINEAEFGKCPTCHKDAKFISDSSKDEIKNVMDYKMTEL